MKTLKKSLLYWFEIQSLKPILFITGWWPSLRTVPVCVCSVLPCVISNIKAKVCPIYWPSNNFCHHCVLSNFSYDKHYTWPQFLSSRENHSGCTPEIHPLCYTSPKCIWALLKLNSLAEVFGLPFKRNLSVTQVWLILSPALTSYTAKYQVTSQRLIPVFLLCPIDNLVVLEIKISER